MVVGFGLALAPEDMELSERAKDGGKSRIVLSTNNK